MASMRLTILGTAAGSLAVHERHHTAFAVEAGDGLYWLDAGESCTRTAFLTGLDLLNTRCVFVTHAAMDHVGGLPHLLWTIRKLNRQAGALSYADRLLHLFVPYAPSWYGVIEMLEAATLNHYARDFILKIAEYRDGLIFQDNDVSVFARHNSHRGPAERGDAWHSYGFRVQSRTSALVYTGDVDVLEEIDPLLADPCDLLLFDAAHIDPKALAERIKTHGFEVGRLGFVHLDQERLDDMASTCRAVRDILGTDPLVPDDGDQVDI